MSFFDKRSLPTPSSRVSLEKIALELKSNPEFVRSKIFYWIHRGVLIEHTQQKKRHGLELGLDEAYNRPPEFNYSIVEDYKSTVADIESEMMEEGVSNLLEVEDDMIEEEHEAISNENLTYKGSDDSSLNLEKNIAKLLNNYGPKRLDKLFSITEMLNWSLKLSFTWTPSQLQEKLDLMIKKGLIISSNSIYYANPDN